MSGTRLRVVALLAAACVVAACSGTSGTPAPSGAATAAASAPAGGSPSAAAGVFPDEITIAYTNNPDPTMLLEKRGYLEQAMPGTKINYKYFELLNDAFPLLVANQVDFIAGHSSALGTISLMQDVPIKSFLLLGTDQTIRLVAKEGSGIKSCADLKGKRVGTPFAGIAQYLLFGCMLGSGLDPATDATILDIKSADLLPAWDRGEIDAAMIWAPHADNLAADGGEVVLAAKDVADLGYPFAIMWSVRDDFAEQYPDALEAIMKAAQQTYTEYEANPEEIIREVTEVNVPQPTDADYESFKIAMEGTHFPTCAEHLSPTWYGTADAPGQYLDMITKTANFLKDQKVVDTIDLSLVPDSVSRVACERILAEAGEQPAPSAPNY